MHHFAAPHTLAQRSQCTLTAIGMQADRPLLTYGLSDGDVLDIVPWQPAVRSAVPAAVSSNTIELHQPVLSSPTHALYLSWQRAADGLRAGVPYIRFPPLPALTCSWPPAWIPPAAVIVYSHPPLLPTLDAICREQMCMPAAITP